MNDYQYWQLAQERQREMLDEARRARLLKEAGYREELPGAMKASGLVLLVLPIAAVLMRAVTQS